MRNGSFIDDEEKMKDFTRLTKEEFLRSYSYLTDKEYENTKRDLEILNTSFDGEEACPECGEEVYYNIKPFEQTYVTCPHCGYKKMLICSLCDQPRGCNAGNNKTFCKFSIWETLLEENEIENKFPDNIMRRCRERLGLESDDTSRDKEINIYSPREAFEACCEWEGLIGYTYLLLRWIQDCYGIDLEEVRKQR